MPSVCEYMNRDLDIQIRIDNLIRFHDHKYPLSWYESLSDSQIRAMHTEAAVAFAQSLVMSDKKQLS